MTLAALLPCAAPSTVVLEHPGDASCPDLVESLGLGLALGVDSAAKQIV